MSDYERLRDTSAVQVALDSGRQVHYRSRFSDGWLVWPAKYRSYDMIQCDVESGTEFRSPVESR